jgi:hypothetical protein
VWPAPIEVDDKLPVVTQRQVRALMVETAHEWLHVTVRPRCPRLDRDHVGAFGCDDRRRNRRRASHGGGGSGTAPPSGVGTTRAGSNIFLVTISTVLPTHLAVTSRTNHRVRDCEVCMGGNVKSSSCRVRGRPKV